MTRYPFPQTPCIVPGEIATLFQDFEKIGVVADHILDLYLLSHAAKNVPHDLGNPYQYMRKVTGLTTDALAIRYTDFEKTFNRNYPLLRSTSALDFLSAHAARYRHKADDSGLNNGMIYDRFFARVAGNDRVVMIDPPLSFIYKLIGGPQPCAHIQFFFTIDRYAEVLQKDPQLCRFTPRHFHKIKHLYADKVLIFGADLSYEHSKTMFSTLHDKVKGNNIEFFALLPTAFMDQRGKECLRYCIEERYSIQLIALIPGQATNISPRKRCMLVMRPGVGHFREVISGVGPSVLFEHSILHSQSRHRGKKLDLCSRNRMGYLIILLVAIERIKRLPIAGLGPSVIIQPIHQALNILHRAIIPPDNGRMSGITIILQRQAKFIIGHYHILLQNQLFSTETALDKVSKFVCRYPSVVEILECPASRAINSMGTPFFSKLEI